VSAPFPSTWRDYPYRTEPDEGGADFSRSRRKAVMGLGVWLLITAFWLIVTASSGYGAFWVPLLLALFLGWNQPDFEAVADVDWWFTFETLAGRRAALGTRRLPRLGQTTGDWPLTEQGGWQFGVHAQRPVAERRRPGASRACRT
jgi:hypothetical protein